MGPRGHRVGCSCKPRVAEKTTIIIHSYCLIVMIFDFFMFSLQNEQFDLSFASIWNVVVWLMLMNFFIKIVNSTAQRHLKEQQQVELADRLLLLRPAKSKVSLRSE